MRAKEALEQAKSQAPHARVQEEFGKVIAAIEGRLADGEEGEREAGEP